jgi:hypothetical protein
VAPPGGGDARFFVGPDNGLLIAAAELAAEAPIAQVFALQRDDADGARGATFDGRDLFAPAAAALCRGVPAGDLGDPVDPESLVRLLGGVVEHGRLKDGRRWVRAEVTWVDHFGNIQLAATVADARSAGMPLTGTVDLTDLVDLAGLVDEDPGLPQAAATAMTLRCVETFSELARGELGLLMDANGHLAIVAGEASAAHWLNVTPGELVAVAW